MNISCEIIMDLLPLYYDGVCTESSKKLVDAHLKECAECRRLLEKIRDNTLDGQIKRECDNVVSHHARAVKRKSLITGFSIASVMAVPVLVSMIVNLATGRVLDWFFIVLTALMTLGSVTVVPLIFEKNRWLLTLGSFTGSLTLLLLTCAIYTGGDWFFVSIIPVYFGLLVMFAPYVISKLPITGRAMQHKGVLAMAVNTLFLFAVITVSGLYMQSVTWAGYWFPALLITTFYLLLPWGIFLIIRYFKTGVFTKAGLSVIFGSLFLFVAEIFIDWILEGMLRFRILDANLLQWNNEAALNGNIELIVLLAGLLTGGIFLAIGALRKKRF